MTSISAGSRSFSAAATAAEDAETVRRRPFERDDERGSRSRRVRVGGEDRTRGPKEDARWNRRHEVGSEVEALQEMESRRREGFELRSDVEPMQSSISEEASAMEEAPEMESRFCSIRADIFIGRAPRETAKYDRVFFLFLFSQFSRASFSTLLRGK